MSIEKAHVPTKEEADKIAEVMTPTQRELTGNREKMKTGLSNAGIEGHLYRKESSWEGRLLNGHKDTFTGNLNGHEIVYWEVRPDSHLDTLDPHRESLETWEKKLKDEGPLWGGSVDGQEMNNEQATKFRYFASQNEFWGGENAVDVDTENRLLAQAQRELGMSKIENSAQALEDFFATFKK